MTIKRYAASAALSALLFTAPAFAALEDVPISDANDAFHVRLYRVGKNSITLKLDFVRAGRKRDFDSISAAGYTERKTRIIDYKDGFNERLSVLGAEFVITEWDDKNETLKIQWPEDADPAVRVPIPEQFTRW